MLKISKDLQKYVINPLKEIAKEKNFSERQRKWREFLDKLLGNKQKYFEMIVNNYEYFVDFKNKNELRREIIQNSIDEYFREVLYYIHKFTYQESSELNFDESQLKKINSIYNEFNHYEIETYNIKLYQQKSIRSISELQRKIFDIIEKNIAEKPKLEHFTQKDMIKFPKVSFFANWIQNEVRFTFYFFQNPPNIFSFNDIYIRLNFCQSERYRENPIEKWEDVSENVIDIINKILKDIILLEDIIVKDLIELPDSIKKFIELKDFKFINKMEYYILEKLQELALLGIRKNFKDALIQHYTNKIAQKSTLALVRAVYEELIENLVINLGGSTSNMKANLKFLETQKVLIETPKNKGLDKNLEYTSSYTLFGLLSNYGSHSGTPSPEIINTFTIQTISLIYLILRRYEQII